MPKDSQLVDTPMPAIFFQAAASTLTSRSNRRPRRSSMIFDSWRDCRFGHHCADILKKRPRRKAVSAVMARSPIWFQNGGSPHGPSPSRHLCCAGLRGLGRSIRCRTPPRRWPGSLSLIPPATHGRDSQEYIERFPSKSVKSPDTQTTDENIYL